MTAQIKTACLKQQVLIFLFILFTCNAFAQVDETQTTEHKKNAVFLSTGIYQQFFGYSANYERVILHNPSKVFNAIIARGAIGGWYNWQENLVYDEAGYFYNGGLSFLIGRKISHLEFYVGYGRRHRTSTLKGNYNSFFYNLGYRYEHPNNNFFFRAGVSNIEAIYMSFGLSF